MTISGDQPTETITLSDLQNSELSETQSVMTYQNVSLVQGRARDNEDGVIFEILSYGGWQEYHVFSAQAAFLPSADKFEQILIHGYSIGSPTGTNPVSGSGTWRGVMVGTEVHRGDDNSGLIHHFLQGDAELKLSFLHELEAEVYFTNIRYLDTGDFLDDMGWTHLHLEDGRFRGGVSIRGSGWVDGYFYGPDHEEAGGIFELDSIVGAFGAERVPGPSFFSRFPGIPWPTCRDCNIDYRVEQGAEALDLTSAEIGKIYEDLGALVESPAVLDDYLPFIDDAEFQTLWTEGGISFAQWRYGDEDGDDGTLIGYGAWLDYNFFGIDADNLDGAGSQPIARPYSFGDATGSNPTAQGGSGTWEGAMVGFSEHQPFVSGVVPKVRGAATITISDFLNPSVNATFSFSRSTITWADIPLMDGSFKTVDDLGEIEGRFYGPNHEEVGGTLSYKRYDGDQLERVVYGAFGASRND